MISLSFQAHSKLLTKILLRHEITEKTLFTDLRFFNEHEISDSRLKLLSHSRWTSSRAHLENFHLPQQSLCLLALFCIKLTHSSVPSVAPE